ncbi:MAG: hypothetical protein J4203_05945 [Candidatus Diapherotrites archaeon]|uniref:Uncharacterized protein n=1 Tax=Candidatus Iainarchaeum sp. TaxID=3101447 RepID=A0A8T4L9P4_9ARCH|nr:hypothetical protein [Candidatus Diapherotrites archaeon]
MTWLGTDYSTLHKTAIATRRQFRVNPGATGTADHITRHGAAASAEITRARKFIELAEARLKAPGVPDAEKDRLRVMIREHRIVITDNEVELRKK